MGEEQKELPPMTDEEQKDFIEELFRKRAFVENLQASGLNVEAAERAVEQQIRDTVTKGDPKKA